VQHDEKKASAAPVMPREGINTAFIMMFNTAPIKLTAMTNRVFPMTVRVRPFNPTKVWTIKLRDKICTARAASTYELPKRKCNTGLGNKKSTKNMGIAAEKIHFVNTWYILFISCSNPFAYNSEMIGMNINVDEDKAIGIKRAKGSAAL
jgi:hypothetical protein